MTDPPSSIQAHQAAGELQLQWEPAAPVRVGYRELRAQCPCASCRDEWTGQRLLDPASIREDLQLEAMEPVGNYAIRLAWNDGHGSGLFTWDFLKQLADQAMAGRWTGVNPPPPQP